MTLGRSRTRKWSAKVRQMVPKGSQKIAKGSQERAEGRPKCIKNSMFEKGREKGAPRAICQTIPRSILGAIFH